MQTNTHHTVLKTPAMSGTHDQTHRVITVILGNFLLCKSSYLLPRSDCDKAGSEGIHAASTGAGPLFYYHLFVVLLTVCLPLSVCLSLARVYLHSPNTSIFMMEAGHPRCVCVCVCVCVQDLIGLWSEGNPHTESQVEREGGSHCSEHYTFSIVSFPILLYTLVLLRRWYKMSFHQGRFGLIQR